MARRYAASGTREVMTRDSARRSGLMPRSKAPVAMTALAAQHAAAATHASVARTVGLIAHGRYQPPLERHDPIVIRSAPSAQVRQDGARRTRERPAECIGRPEDLAIALCAPDHEDHPFDPSVSALQVDLALQRLKVVEVGFGLDCCARDQPIQQHVERPLISVVRDRPFAPASDRWWQPSLEVGQQPQMTGVAEGRTRRICLCPKVKADRAESSRRLHDGQPRSLATFNPADLRPGHPHGGSQRVLADSSHLASRAEFGPDHSVELPSPSHSNIGRPLAHWHRSMMATWAYRAITARFDPGGGSTDHGADGRRWLLHDLTRACG